MNIGGEFLVNFRESGSGYNVVIGNAVNFCVGDFLPSGLIRVYPNATYRRLATTIQASTNISESHQ